MPAEGLNPLRDRRGRFDAHVVEHELRAIQPRAIESLVRVDVGTHGAAVDGHTRKEALGPRVAEDLGAQLQIGAGLRVTSYRSGRDRGISTKLELGSYELLEPAPAQDDEHEVGCL